jgi:hypothetical protein
VENSGQGTIQSTLDMFLTSPLKICGEVELRVHQYLLSRTGPIEDIERVYSHALSLAPVPGWLRQHLPEGGEARGRQQRRGRARAPATPTTRPPSRARTAGHVYGLKIGRRPDRGPPRQHHPLPGDRAASCSPPSGHDRTSLMVFVRDQPGALFKVLQPLARYGISMNRIESRPRTPGCGSTPSSSTSAATWRNRRCAMCSRTWRLRGKRHGAGLLSGGGAVNDDGAERPADSRTWPLVRAGLRAYDPGHDLVAMAATHRTVAGGAGLQRNPWGASPAARAAVLDCLHALHRYPDPLGGDLKRALSQAHGVPTSEALILGNGSHELLMQMAQVFAGARR